MNISLDLTVEQVNIILNALLARPYGEVASLMDEIKKQAEGQINQAEPAGEE